MSTAHLVRLVKPLELILCSWGQYPAQSNEMMLHWISSVVQVLYSKGGRELVELGYTCHWLYVQNKQNSARVSGSLA